MTESTLTVYSSWSIGYFVSLLVYLFTVCITPGPNNIMLTASGMNFGRRRTMPHLAGIMFGCFIMLLAVAFGLGSLFGQYPVLHWLLKIVGSLYLLWLAYKIYQSSGPDINSDQKQPISFWQAFWFQFVNPKAWVMTITSISAFSVPGELLAMSIALVIVLHMVVGLPCSFLWAVMGERVSALVEKPEHLAWFNRTLALATLGCVVVILT
jgi:threonine/homoserine/homoserine lactone efflux protein